MAFMCKDCNSKEYSSQYSLNRHLKEVHGQFDLRIQTYPFHTFDNKCLEGCYVSFNSTKDLRQHLTQKHAKLIQQAIYEFSDVDDFLSWKVNLSKSHEYVDTCGSKSNGDLEITYYYCQSERKVLSKGPENSLEEILSAQELHNASCTSEIIVIKNLKRNVIAVTYFKTHYGHENCRESINVPTNCLVKKTVHLTSSMPERLLENSEKILHIRKPKKRFMRKTIKSLRSTEVNNKVTTENISSNLCQNVCFNKRAIKKDIISLLQELSENTFEVYDENTLNLVRQTLSECCQFLSSYEKTEEPTQDVDQNLSTLILNPPKLLLFAPTM